MGWARRGPERGRWGFRGRVCLSKDTEAKNCQEPLETGLVGSGQQEDKPGRGQSWVPGAPACEVWEFHLYSIRCKVWKVGEGFRQ